MRPACLLGLLIAGNAFADPPAKPPADVDPPIVELDTLHFELTTKPLEAPAARPSRLVRAPSDDSRPTSQRTREMATALRQLEAELVKPPVMSPLWCDTWRPGR